MCSNGSDVPLNISISLSLLCLFIRHSQCICGYLLLLFELLFVIITYLSWNRHLIVAERFACPCDPESCVVWSLVLLVGSLMAEWSQVRGQTKNGSKNSNE